MKVYESESGINPPEWDATSSVRVVYHNYNVEQVERRDDINGESEPRIVYVYDVDEYTKEEYAAYLVEKNRADIDYIAVMKGVDLNV